MVKVRIPEIIDLECRGMLLPSILAMPAKRPISLEDAGRLLVKRQTFCFNADLFGYEEGHYGWYDRNFVSWISALGYHINLSGEEFEPYQMSDKLL